MLDLCRSAFCYLVLLFLPTACFGQAVYGSIVGTVLDSSNAAIPHAKVTVRDVGKGVTYTTSSNEMGNYSQGHLIVGLYEVRVEASGFDTYVQRNVDVEVDANTQVNAQLHPGQVGEVVNVTGEVPLLKTERSDVSDTMTQKAVMELPVFSRDISRLYFLIPGVQATGTTAASEQPQDIYRPSVGGQYWGGISFQLDGTDNRESVLGEPVITPNLDAVSELKITTTAYDAEFGQASQAVISAQTKSGTNTLHGGAFWRRRTSTASRDLFAQAQPVAPTANHSSTFGTVQPFGGPIQKDKTFIFGDYQGTGQERRLAANARSHRRRAGPATSDLGTLIFQPATVEYLALQRRSSVRQQFAGHHPYDSLYASAGPLNYIPPPNADGYGRRRITASGAARGGMVSMFAWTGIRPRSCTCSVL